mmetsp:Transcript_35903/g.143515  ORF Transcript_35903/g.143515 Transcript_35903/m.143515 type:complete len:123 (+) Transcript_35903:145-513(+)
MLGRVPEDPQDIAIPKDFPSQRYSQNLAATTSQSRCRDLWSPFSVAAHKVDSGRPERRLTRNFPEQIAPLVASAAVARSRVRRLAFFLESAVTSTAEVALQVFYPSVDDLVDPKQASKSIQV